MTDRSREIDIDAFPGFNLVPDAPVPPDHLAAEAAVEAALAAVTPIGVAEAVRVEEPAPEPSGKPVGNIRERLLGLIARSGTGNDQPHIVTVHRNDDGSPSAVTCPCKAGTYNRRGCWAMRDTRVLLGLPEEA